MAASNAPVWIETSPFRRDLTDVQGGLLGIVTRLYGRWCAEIVVKTARSANVPRELGDFPTEAEACAAVELRAGVSSPATLPEIARRFAPAASAPLTHIVHFTIPRRGSADERILAETQVGDTAASVVEYLGSDQLNDRVLTAVYAADLTEGAERLTNVTAAILRDVAAYVEAAAIELPRSLDDAFTRHGIPQPMAWVEAYRLRDLDFDEHALGPAETLNKGPARWAA